MKTCQLETAQMESVSEKMDNGITVVLDTDELTGTSGRRIRKRNHQ